LSESGQKEVDLFLGTEENKSRLFVWLLENSETLDASCQQLPKQRIAASIVFCKSGDVPITHASQIQCMTLQQQQAPSVNDNVSPDESASQATPSIVPVTSVLQTLQLYTRECFLPTLQSVNVTDSSSTDVLDAVVGKVRELDVALAASSRSARLPHVILELHPRIAEAAAKKQGDKLDWEALGLSDCLTDDDFLNTVQAGVSQWILQIRKITALPSTVELTDTDSVHAAPEEVAFWTQLASELESIQEQLKYPGVEITLAMLRETKRFVATLALENDTGMEQAVSYTSDVNNFIKPYPLQMLQAARDFDKIVEAVNAIFLHMPKIRQSRYYSLERSAALLTATTVILRESLLSVLREQYSTNLLFMEYKEYESKIRFPSLDVFAQFDDKLAVWKDFFTDQARRRKLQGVSRVLEKMTMHHLSLKTRLDQIHEFRHQQERLREVVHAVLREEEPEAIQQVEQAPRQIFSSLNVLDLTVGGTKALDAALEEYDLQMDTMEERLARLLREKLQACRVSWRIAAFGSIATSSSLSFSNGQDAEDMFRVFARFNLLLTRTRVRAAVKEFQMQLISTVAVAVEKLQSKFTLKYESSAAARLSRLRGIPPVAGKILWAKQMERQVHTLMERMSNVLGPNWGQQLEGRQLRKSGDELLAKLDARSFFRNWVMEWEKQLASAATSKMSSFPIKVEPEGRGGLLVSKVNFDEKSELLFKEIRYLKWLGYGKDVPRTLSMVSEEAVARYPFAVAIKTALRSYQAVRVLVTSELEPLVMPQLLEIRDCIAEAFDVKLSKTIGTKKRRVRWDTKKMTDWVTRLTESVTKFEDRVEQLLRACDKVDIALNLLETVDYDPTKFRAVLSSIQKTIDEMSLSGYSDLESWVNVVADKMAEVLSKRLELGLKAWNKTFKVLELTRGDETADAVEANAGDFSSITIPVSATMDIVLRNQEISTVPAVPTVRSLFVSGLHDFLGVVCDLPKPKGGRYEVFDGITAKGSISSEDDFETFDHLVGNISPQLLSEAYSVIEYHVGEASAFADQWLAYQTLWDTQVSDVAASVGLDIDRWQQLLVEASNARSTLDSSATVAQFGPLTVKYGKVQSQINLKYDSWQKELQSSFASILSQCMQDAHEKIAKAKTTLEETTLDSASTESILVGVTYIQEMKQKVYAWAKEVEGLRESEKVLKRQRFVFHSEWMETSVVKGLYDSLLQILERRSRSMEQQVPVLQARVASEDRSATKLLFELLGKWQEEKPLRGNLSPTVALSVLAKYELTMKKSRIHQENLVKAKDALGLSHTGDNSEVAAALNELSDLKEVWEAMVEPHKLLEDIKGTLWSVAAMRKIRRGLDDLLAAMRSLPNRIRQYDSYTQLQEAVKGFISGHGFLSDLKTDALKERHWKMVFQRLGINVPLQDLTVGLLWDHGALNRKKEIGEILATAQGEMAIEVFLGDIRARWMKQELEFALYQNRTRLIKGWDDLFATLDDHISGLALMKSSPYFRAVREFQEEGKLWEDRLTVLRAAFDSWADVQRRWVYLEGILFGSSDIKAQLPAEWSRFKSVDSEFVALMRRIASKPFAIEVLSIDNLQRTLERLMNLMSVIQRALGEYLAKQRADFSRFYFLGDDDLLEIMGSSGEPGKVLAHVGKMFSGIAGARLVSQGLLDGTRARLDAMVSKDGEVVPFDDPIDVTEQTNVKDWLKLLESRMQSTLAGLLDLAVTEDGFTAGGTLNDDSKTQFLEWTTKFPAQVRQFVCFVYASV
jgi:dynein heavy chain 1, cytosolic